MMRLFTKPSLTLWLSCAVVAGLHATAMAQPVVYRTLTTAQIRAALSGRQLTDGHHWAHHYLAGGRVMLQESGPQQLGRWSAQHGQLCLIHPRISKTEPACYEVQGHADELRYVDNKQVVYQGFVRGRADASLFGPTGKH